MHLLFLYIRQQCLWPGPSCNRQQLHVAEPSRGDHRRRFETSAGVQAQGTSPPGPAADPEHPQPPALLFLWTKVSDETPQSLATRPAHQRAPNHPDEEVSLKSLPAYYFLAIIISCNTQAETSCLQPCTKGAARETLPRFTAAAGFAEQTETGTERPGARSAALSVHRRVSCQTRQGPPSEQLLKLLLLQNRNPPKNTQSSSCGG